MMNEEKARELLKGAIKENDDLFFEAGSIVAIDFEKVHRKHVILRAEFTADELEAIAWWMRNKGV
jgi:hypothetical protein